MKHLLNTLLAVVLFVFMGGALPTAFADDVQPVVNDGYFLVVDGNHYQPTQEGGPARHYETPDVNPQAAHSDRHVWTGNGSEQLPCEGGIHWIDNANLLTVSHCLDVPPSTTTTTTEPPSTTTTSPTTTQPPVTTTTVSPTTTTSTTTTTTEPPATTTTQPPEDWFTVELACDWDNHDKDQGAHEPILSWWDYGADHKPIDNQFVYVVYDRVSGATIGHVEFNTAFRGYHDSWVSNSAPVPETGFIVELYHNGGLYLTLDDPTCLGEVPPETTTTQPPTPTTQPPTDPACNEGHPTWNEEAQNCALPHTGWPLAIFGGLGAFLTFLGWAMVRAGDGRG